MGRDNADGLPLAITEESKFCEESLDVTAVLPDVFLLSILSLLDASDLVKCQGVCKRWLRLGREQMLWRELGRSKLEFQTALQATIRSSGGADPADWLNWYKLRHNVLKRWRNADPASVTTLDDHAGTVFGVTTIPGSPHLIASGGEDAILRVWNTSTQRVVVREPSSNLSGIFNVHSFAAADGGPWVVACGFSGDVNVHKIEAHERGLDALTVSELRVLLQPRMPAEDDLFWQLTKAELVECAERRGIESPSTARHLFTFVGHSAPVVSCRGRGDTLATSSFDSSIRLWRMEAPSRRGAAEEITVCQTVLTDTFEEQYIGGPHENSIACVCLPPAQPGLLMRGGNDSMVKVWDIAARSVLRSYGGHAGWIWCLESTDDSGHVLVSGATDMTVRLWDTRAPGNSAELHCELVRSSGPVAGLKVLPDQRRFVTGSFDGGVRLWDLRGMSATATTRALVGTLAGHQDRTTRVDATVDCVYSASFDSTVKMWSFI